MALLKKKPKFYSLDRIKEINARYNIIFGERGNGKTFAVLEEIVKNYFRSGKKGAIIRRWEEDFKGKRGSMLFNPMTENGIIERESNGLWTHVFYRSKQFYFARIDDDGKMIHAEFPFAYAYTLTTVEHDKGESDQDITVVFFDEFITRGAYLPDETTEFFACLSTIIRHRDDVTIYMCANTVNKYGCPYFDEMGLTNIKTMKQGTIDVYTYGDSGLRVAVEYCGNNGEKSSKPSDIYFAFNNENLHLQMITSGAWELDIHPHLPEKYLPKEVFYTYFIEFDGELLQCEIVAKSDRTFTYIHPKTTKLQERPTDIIFSLKDSPLPNHRKYINKPYDKIGRTIWEYFLRNKVFYSSNEVGEIVQQYIANI